MEVQEHPELSPKTKRILRLRRQIYDFFASKKQQKLIVVFSVVTFAVVGVVITLRTNAREVQLASEESVQLADGKTVKLNQSIDEIKPLLGDKLLQLNNQQYVYRERANAPVEVVLGLDTAKRVVVIHLVNQPRNKITATDARVGVSLEEYRQKLRRTLPLSGEIANIRKQGMAFTQIRSTQYFFSDPCSTGAKADMISLVTRGHEARLLKDLGGPDCVDKD